MGTAGLATRSLLQSQLGARKRNSPARRAEFLPCVGCSRHAIVESQLRQHSLEIVDVHLRGKALPASDALRAGIGFSGTLIKLDSQLRRTLKDVEELPEGKIEQRCDHHYGVQDREETVKLSAQPLLGYGQGQPRHRDREQKDDGKEIHRKILYRLSSAIPHAPPQGEEDPSQHQECGYIQAVEEQPGDQ